MGTPPNRYLATAIAIFFVLAVVFAAFGGRADTEPHRNLFAAGAGFWLLMVFVPWMFSSVHNWSTVTHSTVSAAYGALVGLCIGLCFSTGEGWIDLLEHAAAGSAIGFAGFWLSLLRMRALWLAQRGKTD